jgi:regulatory protein
VTKRSGYRPDGSRTTAKGRAARSASGRRSASDERATQGAENDAALHAVVSEAEVVMVEVHPKRHGMYRVAVRLREESSEPGTTTDAAPQDWNDEVDALIAGSSAAHSPTGESETVITVHEDTLVSLRLLKGRRLTAEEWEALRREEDKEDAYRSALAILERKARTSKELSEALKRKGYGPEIIQGCLKRLQDRRMLDDSSYARRYAEQKASGQRKGRRLIRQELMQRGITKEDADQALGALDEDVEREAALTLTRKKWPQLKGEIRERKQKLAAFLLRRGYPSGIVREALQQVTSEARAAYDPDADLPFEEEDTASGVADWEPID